MNPDPTILTIGHSNHTEAAFLELLQKHNVQHVLDVRSHPRSRYLPHFNRPGLAQFLRQHHIEYTHYGDTLGGRPALADLYTPEGQADYQQMALTQPFQRALRQVASLAHQQNAALMCTEARPQKCHRALLVGHQLHTAGVKIAHIQPNEETPTRHIQMLEELIQHWNTDNVHDALTRQIRAHAYRKR